MKIVILGGGFGGIYTLKYLHKFFHGYTRTNANSTQTDANKVNTRTNANPEPRRVQDHEPSSALVHGLTRTDANNNETRLHTPRQGTRQNKVKLVLVNKKNYFIFTPLLHEVATGGVSLDNALEPVREIIKCCDFDFVHGKVEKIDLENRVVYVNTDKENYKIDYDYLVIALGSKTNYYGITEAKEYSYPLKTIDDAIRLKNHFVHMFELASLYPEKAKSYLTFVIVGGGATGVEIAGEMSDLFYKSFSKLYPPALISQVKIILIERGKELIPQFSPKLRQKALARLKKLKVDVILEKGVIEVGENFIKLDDGSIIETKTVIWTAGVEPNLPEIVGNVEKDNKERLILNEYLQVKKKVNAELTERTQNLQNNTQKGAELTRNSQKNSESSDSSASVQHSSAYENVFAIGDICCFIQNEKPLPQLAQVAVRQAKTIAVNIKNSIENKPLEKFVYKHTGDLISVGKFYALGEIKGIEFSGLIIWFIWKGVYLSKMISFRDQVKTFIDWILNLFLPRDITEL
ncbi:MAG: pyridine nucleotide-disulfide oxidoreductase [Candidatus Parcubacteria bacterium]|nr:MAG: pyridine nucleotide-disulfide oxidoreductase [Candidatus Parcubacteria bacterium]